MASRQDGDRRPVIFITGCGSGLGLALARILYSQSKYRAVVTARGESFQRLRDEFRDDDHFLVRELDVTDDNRIHTLVNEICLAWGTIDVLINNAGVCYRSVVEHMDIESEYRQLKTNYLGPMSLVRSVLPMMRERKSGRIINISSVSGMVSMPTMASYSASKHALEGATEALWYEARPYGIRVSLVQPGFINSDSFKHVVLSKKANLSSRLQGPHSEYYDSMGPFIERLMSWSRATPESIALKILDLVERDHPPLRVSVTPDAILFRILRRLLPAELFHRLMFLFLPGSRVWGQKRLPRRMAGVNRDLNRFQGSGIFRRKSEDYRIPEA